MLCVVLAHQIYQVFVSDGWRNPLFYVLAATPAVLCGAIVIGVGTARARSGGGISRLYAFSLAIPWFLAVAYMFYGIVQLGGVFYGLVAFRDHLSQLVQTLIFWRLLVWSLITGCFWTMLGNSLRKNINGLATNKSSTQGHPSSQLPRLG